MLVVHALAVADGYRIWAEQASAAELGAARRPDDHPFAASSGTLAEIVEIEPASGSGASGGGPSNAGAGGGGDVPVLLPSGSGGPAPSPELAAGLADATVLGTAGPLPAAPDPSEPELRQWLVPTVRPDPVAGLGVFRDGGEGWVAGAALRFLLAVEEFAVDLVGRGRVLPALRFTGDGEDAVATARWVPVLTGADLVRFEALRDTVPSSFRAAPGTGGDDTGPAPDEALRGVLDVMVDGTVRARLAGPGGLDGLVSRPRARRGQRGEAADAGKAARTARSSSVTVAADWLGSLAGGPQLAGPSSAARTLADRVDAWRARGTAPPTVRACFRLREPRGKLQPDDAWRVEFLLRSAVDPSVLVTADRVWAMRGAVPTPWADRPDEALMAALGQAVAVWPTVERALVEAEPTGIDLDAEGAYEFLRGAEALELAGFGVLLPTWWRRSGRPTVTLTARPANAISPVLRDAASALDEIVDFRWGVALGGVDLTLAELRELAAAKVPLVQVRGRWAYADPVLLAAGLEMLRRATTGQTTVREVLSHAGLGPAADPPADDVEVRAEGWLAGLLPAAPAAPGTASGGGRPVADGAAPSYLEFVDPPAGLGVTLRPYQRRGLSWLAFLDRLGVGALLADDMGLGKTVQLLALELLCRAGGRRPPTLVVCPTSVVGNWAREAERVAGSLRVLVHHAADRPDGSRLAAMVADYDLVVTTYPVVRQDVETLSAVSWDRIVLDEAQLVKNSETVQSRAVRRLSARHKVALTGTPVENRLADLWSVMDFLNPGLLGGAGTFRARYAVPIERYGDAEAAARLRRRIRPVVLRRVKSDPAVLDDLPEKIETRQLCTLTTEQASLYQAVVDDMLERLADRSLVRRKGIVLAAMTKLKQACNHPAHLLGDGSPLSGRSGKLTRLEEVLEQVVADGERALCFTQFARFGAALTPYLADRFGVETLFLHGGTPRAERDALVERFQTGRGPGIFLLSLKAGGFGLNLTAANHVIHIDRWWNPASEAQATDRAYRIGQRRGVQVHTFLCMGTLEERVDRMLVDKATLARATMGASGEGWLATLTTDQLADLVALAPAATDG